MHLCLLQEAEPSPSLLRAYADYWAALPGPRFACSMLVGGSCEEVCDWTLALRSAHDFGGLRQLSHDPVLVLDPSGGSALRAEFLRRWVESQDAVRSAGLR